MGSLVAFIPRRGATAEAGDIFLRATRAIKEKKCLEPESAISNEWSFAASFRRWNGSGTPIAVDRETSSWLAVLGTSFHQSGNNHPEYLLKQYLMIGAERLVRDMEGFFVVVAGDSSTHETIVTTDVVGSLHFYYRQFRAGIALSTSSRVLSELEEVSLDSVGCQEFLGTGVMYEDRTFYNEVKKLPPATITRFSDGSKVNQQLYWNVADLTPELLAGEQAAEALWEGLSSAVAKINKQFESVACDLTGGYDSRAVAAAFVEGRKKFVTVVSGPPDSADVMISRDLAAMLGLEHIHYAPQTSPITTQDLEAALQLTEGEYDLVEYANVARIHRDLSQRFQISINGSFGEIARAYYWELLFPRTGARRKLDSHKLAARRYAWGSCGALFQPQYQVNLIQHMTGVIDRTIAGLETYPNTFQMDATYLRMRMQRWQGRIASSTNQIWPCLSPFMFRTALETMLQARFAVRERSLLVRLMLAKYQPSLGAYPLEHGYPALPATWKTIPRFWPLVPYYAGKVIHRLESRLLREQPEEPKNPRWQLWRTDEVRALLKPSSMKSMAILDPTAVAAFLEGSQKPGFSQGSEWNRLLSLEWALSGAAVSG